MIVIEILDESGTNFYEILGIDPKEISGADDKAVSRLVRERSNKAKTEYHMRALKGDEEAEKLEARINDIASRLKDPKEREAYDKELESGRGSSLEVLRVQPVAPPVFWNRNARFRFIERMLAQAGLSQPAIPFYPPPAARTPAPAVAPGTTKTGAPTYYEIIGLKPAELNGLDNEAVRKLVIKRGMDVKMALRARILSGDQAAVTLEAQLNQVMAVLMDPQRRAEYDRSINL